ncbi:ArgE/DapE family deacylase [Companilactobacillus mishanensis]|uniref:Probable succinyl-diaminopimelate desuccinylase n=2 Tax=Companilactobacillus mishanensis TaxID=2486008 RepID=A0ABW9P4H8_9LACO|nr:ArgE/DapE family deacylase [Companilactobacillus mishanensis]MQS44111.1 ArgE/DapE family deacylase [Companilactobacillus mishanensis]
MDEAEKLNILSKLVSIKSVNDNEKDVAEYIKGLFNDHGIFSEIIPYKGNRANLVAEIGDGDKILAFSGHMDTVMAGDGWTYDPFKLTEKGNELYGRGATDMKSGLAAMVIAMIELKESGVKLNGRVRLLATIAEEVGEYGAKQLTDEGYMKDVDALVIGEPSAYYLVYTHMGSLDIRVTSTGKAAHSSMPDEGFNAIEPLLKFLEQATDTFKNTGASDPELGDFIFNITTIEGGTQVNAIPGSAQAEMNFRTVPDYDNEKVLTKVNGIINDINKQSDNDLKLEIMMNLPSVKAGKNSEIIKLTESITKKYFGDNVQRVGIAGTTDAAMFLDGKPDDYDMVISGPGNATMHKIDESVPKDMYLNFIDIYKEIASRYLN